MPSISVGQSDVHYEWLGEPSGGATLVPLNVIPGDSRFLSLVYAPISDRCPILLIDNTNRGLSTYGGTPISFARQVEELDAVIRAENVARPVWIGSSSTNALAYRAAAAIPSAGLIFIAPILSFNLDRRIALLKEILINSVKSDPTFKAFIQILSLLCSGSQALQRDRFGEMVRLRFLRANYTPEQFIVTLQQSFFPEWDDLDTLARVKCPTLVFRGTEEVIQPLPLMQDALKVLPSYRLVTFDCGHFILSEQTEAAQAEMLAFVAALETTEASGGARIVRGGRRN